MTVFGDEPEGNYNRILLSSVLAGSHQSRDIFINPLPWYAAHGVTSHAGVPVNAIDIERRQVSSASGLVEPCDALVIATGSRGFVPPMDGVKTEAGTIKEGTAASS
jgi:nitrite reductase (NADH) large subunit